MKRFFFIFYGEHAISPEGAFEKCFGTEQQNGQRCRYKVLAMNRPALLLSFYF